MIIKAEASRESLSMIDTALKSQGGIEAAQFLLGQRYIDAYQQVAKKENTIIIPSEPANVAQQIDQSISFFKKN
jgi:regulator of protease activity HflC (stomatin/prohibitin superfamily)